MEQIIIAQIIMAQIIMAQKNPLIKAGVIGGT